LAEDGSRSFVAPTTTTAAATDLLNDAATARLAALIKQHRKFFRKAEMYYVYDCIYHYVSQPFTPTDPKTLFYAARYLLTVTSDGTEVPQDLSKVNILLALARLTTQLQMLRLARQVHERLKQYVVPAHMAEQLEVATLVLRGRPYHDRDELLSTCPRCGQTNPSLPADGGDCCTNCLMPFVRCWASFELLPLVEFTLEQGLADAEAITALNTGHGPRADEADTFSTAPGGGNRGPQSLKKSAADQGAPADVMTFTNDDLVDVAMGLSGGAMGRVIDPFSRQTLQLEISRQESGVKKKQYTPITVGADNLRRLRRDDIFIVHRGWGLPNLYFRNMQPRVAVTLCVSCNHFFKSEDFEFACLRRSGGCPFCRAKAVDAQARVAERIKQQKGSNQSAVKAALGGLSPLRR
jgi:intraflagellar transport protein 122